MAHISWIWEHGRRMHGTRARDVILILVASFVLVVVMRSIAIDWNGSHREMHLITMDVRLHKDHRHIMIYDAFYRILVFTQGRNVLGTPIESHSKLSTEQAKR